MRTLRLLLLALAMLMHLTASAEIHSCCGQVDCSMAECVSLGCLTAQAPAAIDTVGVQPIADGALVKSGFPAFIVPTTIKEIWTPPD